MFPNKEISFPKWLTLGILIEVLIFFVCYLYFDSIVEVFRHSARYSGRVSWFFYLLIFYFFCKYLQSAEQAGARKSKDTSHCLLCDASHSFCLSRNQYLFKRYSISAGEALGWWFGICTHYCFSIVFQ